jgi:hypothetical protein
VNPSNIGLLSSGTAALAAYCNADPLSGGMYIINFSIISRNSFLFFVVYDFNPAQITAAGLAAGAFSQIAIPSASTAPFLSNGYNVPAQYRKLFIGGLSHETSDDQVFCKQFKLYI